MIFFGAICALFAVYFSVEVEGHGYIISPPNRASLWRIDWTQPTNYNDNEYFCGGSRVQYNINEGKCGPCGDDWRDPTPRSNENGGLFGNGIIVANYTAGSVITVSSVITANHLGSLYFHICDLKDPTKPETEECFQPLKLADGTRSYQIHSQVHATETRVQLPKDLVCERCVLRWHYRTGNSWGMCDDGTQDMGCGNQEIFRSCADVRIVPRNPSDDSSSKESDEGDDHSSTPSGENPDEPSDEDSHDDWNDELPCIRNPNYRGDWRRNGRQAF